MKISEKTYDFMFEEQIRKVGPDKKKCHYLKALFNVLVELKPKFCIEIGTNTGKTAQIFQKYFDEYRKDGLLVTCDIKKYTDLSHLKNVKQIIVAHHFKNIDDYHDVDKSSLKYSFEDSIEINLNLLKEAYSGEYDFAFIDGDHTRSSFIKDIQICESVLKEPKFMLLDDTKEPVHECSKVYHEEIKTNQSYHCYDFEDWSKFVGCSLVFKK